MAKSERKSKWKRKFRGIRREKCKKKEALILSSILEQKCSPPVAAKPRRDNKMETIVDESASVQVKGIVGILFEVFIKSLYMRSQTNKRCNSFLKDEMMLAETEAKIYNSKTKRDQNGNYPVWMNQRSIKKLKKRLTKKK
jgi:hypothetical protein